ERAMASRTRSVIGCSTGWLMDRKRIGEGGRGRIDVDGCAKPGRYTARRLYSGPRPGMIPGTGSRKRSILEDAPGRQEQPGLGRNGADHKASGNAPITP